ncbi:MAG TPA: hypothetical protein VI942_00460, partial [Thermoanaerobaculia bacterium]|nr:hypothetical protein [Thermoanaerobaculia bacterium]
AVPGLAERLGLAQRFEWRLASAFVLARSGRTLEARGELAAVRREAGAAGFVAADLEAALLESDLARGAGRGDLAARARAAGFEAVARRAESTPRG